MTCCVIYLSFGTTCRVSVLRRSALGLRCQPQLDTQSLLTLHALTAQVITSQRTYARHSYLNYFKQQLFIPFRYNSTLSTSAKTIDSGQQQQIVRIAGGTVDAGTGIASKEDCAMREVNGSFWKYLNQTSRFVFLPSVCCAEQVLNSNTNQLL